MELKVVSQNSYTEYANSNGQRKNPFRAQALRLLLKNIWWVETHAM